MKPPPFCEIEKRRRAQRLIAIGITIGEDSLSKRPSFDLGLLQDPATLAKFLETLDWMLAEISQAERSLPPEA